MRTCAHPNCVRLETQLSHQFNRISDPLPFVTEECWVHGGLEAVGRAETGGGRCEVGSDGSGQVGGGGGESSVRVDGYISAHGCVCDAVSLSTQTKSPLYIGEITGCLDDYCRCISWVIPRLVCVIL